MQVRSFEIYITELAHLNSQVDVFESHEKYNFYPLIVFYLLFVAYE